MEVLGYIANNLDSSAAKTYTQDFVGSVRMLEDSGFNPFVRSSPLESSLFTIFNRFVEKTGLDTDSTQLGEDYLKENPSARRAVNLYSALENTFASRGAGEKAAIVDFLNSKIDDFVTDKDTDENNALSQEEAGLSDTLFRSLDQNRDKELNAEEVQNGFYKDFSQLNNVLNYFQNTPGALVDTYG